MLHVEFLIEPFVEGQPGRHVTAAIDAAESLGAVVDVGPFGSSCDVDEHRLPDVLAAVGREAFAHGATHVNLQVSRLDAGADDTRPGHQP